VRGGAAWGAKSCAAWLSWRCGLTPVAAREQVRVARRVAELPLVREAFGSGELSYSKVRAITRVATAETEADLAELARHATGAQLERLVRSYRGVLAVALEDVNRVHEERYLDLSWDDDGSLAIRGRLPAEDGALFIAALEAARDQLRERTDDGERLGASAEAPAPAPRRAWTVADASAEAPRADRSPERSGTARPGDLSAAADASAEAPSDPRPAASKADALVVMADNLLAGGVTERSGGDRVQVLLHVDAAALSGQAAHGRCELDDGPALAPETARRLACDASLVTVLERDGRPLDVGRKTRTIPPALRRALHSRDRGCQFPGCTQRRYVDAHHIQHWAHGGETKLSNLLLLCRHHHRLLHKGGYTVERRGVQGVTFRRPDGRAVRLTPKPQRGDRHTLTHRNAPSIDAHTCVPRSAGDRLDYDIAIECLLARDDLLHTPRPAATRE
jgi:hypothetical protein